MRRRKKKSSDPEPEPSANSLSCIEYDTERHPFVVFWLVPVCYHGDKRVFRSKDRNTTYIYIYSLVEVPLSSAPSRNPIPIRTSVNPTAPTKMLLLISGCFDSKVQLLIHLSRWITFFLLLNQFRRTNSWINNPLNSFRSVPCTSAMTYQIMLQSKAFQFYEIAMFQSVRLNGYIPLPNE